MAFSFVVFYSRGRLNFSPKGWFRFPLAIILGIGLPFGLAALFAHLNPYVSLYFFQSVHPNSMTTDSILLGIHGFHFAHCPGIPCNLHSACLSLVLATNTLAEIDCHLGDIHPMVDSSGV